jgi:hypothetical protein
LEGLDLEMNVVLLFELLQLAGEVLVGCQDFAKSEAFRSKLSGIYPFSKKNAQPPVSAAVPLVRQGYQDSKLLLSKPKNLMAPCGASALLIGRLSLPHPIWCSGYPAPALGVLGGSNISD